MNLMLKIFIAGMLAATAVNAGADDFALRPSKVVQVELNGENPTLVDPAQGMLISMANYRLNRILLDFDWSAVAPERYADLEKALLVVDFTAVENPAAVPVMVGAMTCGWRDFAGTLRFGGDPWPKRGVHETSGKPGRWDGGLMEFGYGVVAEQPAVAPGRVAFDLTDAVNDWLYTGKDNYGLILRVGGQHLTGINNQGNWKLEFPVDKVRLELTFAGVAPTPADREARTLKSFPSALLAPVKDPYIFLFYNWNRGINEKFWPHFSVFNTDGIFDYPELAQRGILPLTCRTGPQADWMHDEAGFYQGYRDVRHGVTIDEWQSVDDTKKRDADFDRDTPMGRKLVGAVDALKRIKRERPDCFIGVYWRGEVSMQPLAEAGLPDLVICEGYTRLPRFPQWEIGNAEGIFHFELAKADGYYPQAINLHGTVVPGMYFPDYKRHFTPESIAEEVRILREKYPEVSGSGVYCEIGPFPFFAENSWDEEAAVADVLPVLLGYEAALRKYFIEPAPEVTILEPRFEETITAPKARIVAKATPKEGRTIRNYRWFVDNRLIAETDGNSLLWDTRDVEPGMHVLTVHAVDSGWNRAASQVVVHVGK